MFSETRTRFFSGLRAAASGMRIGAQSSEVRKTYFQLVLVLFLVGTLLTTAGIWSIWHFTAVGADAAWWSVIGWWAVRIAGLLIVLLAAPLIALTLVNAIFPFLGERVFLAAMRVVDPARADALAAMPGTPLTTATLIQIRRMVTFVALSIGVFLASLIPVAGQVLAPVLQTFVSARGLAWELLDPYFDKLQLSYDEQATFVAGHRASLVGFGLPLAWIMAIPLVGPMAFGLAQGAAAKLVAQLEQ